MALTLKIAAIFFGAIGTIATVLPLFYHPFWLIRVFDFPRLQIAVFLAIALVLFAIPQTFHTKVTGIALIVLFTCLVYQVKYIYPYTPIASKQVEDTETANEKQEVSILISNVLTPNNSYQKLIDLVEKWDPDVLLTLESDKTWEEELSGVTERFPHSIKVPLDNLYGMHFYSKLKLGDETKVRYLIADSVPSIHGSWFLPSGKEVFFHCLHPTPPFPGENNTSTDRDGELLLVGKEIEERDYSTIVFGDLNDVAWSKTTSLFKKISGLSDPRRGRGMFSTFNAKYPFFRWPLDHCFHSNDFHVSDIRRLPTIDSDHFPIFIKLQYQPEEGEVLQSDATHEDKKVANDRIDKAVDGGSKPTIDAGK